MKNTLFLLPMLALSALSVQAKVRLSHLISDNMVLQQQTETRLWGWAKAGTTVRVTASWQNQPTTAKAGRDGKWLVKVKTPKASYDPLWIKFDDGDGEVTVRNVLSGEVWVCAGQSNMEMPVKGFWGCPVKDYNQTVIEASNHRAVRSVKIPSIMRMEPQEDAQCEWRECGPQTVSDFSATGYFFARTLHQALNIPIGIIEANKGGSRVEGWLNEENLKRYTDEPLDSVEIRQKYRTDMHYPMMWYNGTIHPVLNYTVGGIIFYQGCSNVGDPGNRYSERLALMVKQWREEFGCGEIPFYFVQIAPFNFSEPQKDENARLQEQQFRALSLIVGDTHCALVEFGHNDVARQLGRCLIEGLAKG